MEETPEPPPASVTGRLQLALFLPVGGPGMMGGRDAQWGDLLAMTRLAEEVGFDAVTVLDHFDGHWEGWSLLAALAGATERIRLVSYVSCVTHRHAAVLAKMAETVDAISRGRLTLGLGAGDSPSEHRMYGFPAERPVARLEETLQALRTIFRDGQASFDGAFVQWNDANLTPRGPRPGGPPLLVGSLGGRRMLRLAAQYADIWTSPVPVTNNTLEGIAAHQALVDAACARHGRDPRSLRRWAEMTLELEGGNAWWSEWNVVRSDGNNLQPVVEHLRGMQALGIDTAVIWVEPNDLSGIERLAPIVEALRG